MRPKETKRGEATGLDGPSFFDVLENQVRKELREEFAREAEAIRAEFDPNCARAGAFESWMASHTEKIVFKSKTARGVYGTPRPHPRPQTKSQKCVRRELTMEEYVALETLNRYSGERLGEEFTETHLKTAWKKAAFNTHPDRMSQTDHRVQAEAAHLFQEVRWAYQILEAAIAAPTSAAA